MRFLVLLLIPSVAAMPVTFDSPFLVNGDVELSGEVTFVALMESGSIEVQGLTNHDVIQYRDASFRADSLGTGEVPAVHGRDEVWDNQPTEALGSWEDSLVVIHGVNASWFGQGVAPSGAAVDSCAVAQFDRGAWIPPEVLCRGEGLMWSSATGGQVSFTGAADALSYSDTSWECQACPDPARWQAERVGDNQNFVQRNERPMGVLDGVMHVRVEGTPVWYALISTPDSLIVDGKLLLHNPEGIGACGACEVEDHVGLALYGRSEMRGFQPDGGRIGAEVEGNWTDARANEVPLEALITSAPAATAAVTVGLAVVIKVLAGLFTRISGEQALEHPKRQVIYGYIQSNPGSNFREILRGTGIAAGTARHHLSMLRRADLTSEQRHKGTLRFFDRHMDDWQRVVLLREPDLERLHGFIEAHPGMMQRAILDHCVNDWGWSRSTTQHRLGRLEEGGLVACRAMGRRRLYEVAARNPERVTTLERLGQAVDASS